MTQYNEMWSCAGLPLLYHPTTTRTGVAHAAPLTLEAEAAGMRGPIPTFPDTGVSNPRCSKLDRDCAGVLLL